MNLAQFFEHWQITENPFRGEEARHDAIFARMGSSTPESGLTGASTHSDFEKVLGDLDAPSTSIVFGEKGAGKTAMRLQIAARIGEHNETSSDRKVFLVPYDDLNAHLDHFARFGADKSKDNPFVSMRLVDHLDAILSIGTGRVVNALLPGPDHPPAARLGEEPVRTARRMPGMVRRDLLLLQALYDTNDPTGARTQRLAKLLRLPSGGHSALTVIGLWLGWIPSVALFVWVYFFLEPEGWLLNAGQLGAGVLLLLWMALLIKAHLLDRLVLARLAGKVSRQLRMVPRGNRGMHGSLARLPRSVLGSGELPVTDSDEQRYEMIARLRRVISEFGFSGIMVVIDRVDEPTLVHGDPERMRSIIWPLLNNKVLQLNGLGFKMLLPIELRHALFKESSAFFQEARLDKQNLIERLSWTGAMLYDLCSARLAVCRPAHAEPIGLVDLFEEDVSRSDVVEALGAMMQPRDAFKFLYRCMSEHCANVTADDGRWRIARHVLEQVRKEEADRVMQLQRGIRPA
jgi:hypothetical protein